MTLAAECAAFSRTTFGKLVQVAPLGLFDGAPRQRLQARALEAAARLPWTIGDRGLANEEFLGD